MLVAGRRGVTEGGDKCTIANTMGDLCALHRGDDAALQPLVEGAKRDTNNIGIYGLVSVRHSAEIRITIRDLRCPKTYNYYVI